MGGAKESPRQKMINLMYLVFISMLALNMSKEVLSAFGMISEQVAENNISLQERIITFETSIDSNFEKEDKIWKDKKLAKDKVHEIATNFITYLTNLQQTPPQKEVKGLKNPINDYEVMDKPDYFNNKFFLGSQGVLKPEGQEFLDKIKAFKTEFVAVVDSLKTGKSDENYVNLINDVTALFDTESEVINRSGAKTTWIEYNYFGFPEVATNTKLTVMKANVLGFQAELLSAMIGGQYKINATLANFDAYVVSDKAAYFPGSKFSGKIVLGKKSENLQPTAKTINDSEIDPIESLNDEGEIELDFTVGSVGTREIVGTITFEEGDGEPIEIPVLSNYEVISKPNSASVQVLGRNTLFRNFENEVKVSVPGIAANLVKATGPGVTDKGNGLYTIKPQKGQELVLNITAELPDGSSFTGSEKFQIRRAPVPSILFNGKEGGAMSRSSMISGSMSAIYDPAYGLESTVRVRSFTVKIGPKSFECTGNALSAKAKSALKKAPKGFDVSFKKINYAGITAGQKQSGPSITIN
ncbi:gliding motility protein GldM [Flavobacteriaceae bacterium]|nr:gliding motility protein GldM [Flavobacteriaceae bacterium]